MEMFCSNIKVYVTSDLKFNAPLLNKLNVVISLKKILLLTANC